MQISQYRPGPIVGRNKATLQIAPAIDASAVWPSSPTLRLKELLKLLSVSRSKAYELMKTDPDFPKGVPLYDSEQSPKFYWTHEAIAWVQGRTNKCRNQLGGN
ncbi:MAG: hypothetical protein DI584_07240 [Stenotrophomonas sp.]|nr:MAG: hypothetical protein DI584_07240 [Stenotrophomonas sp.]